MNKSINNNKCSINYGSINSPLINTENTTEEEITEGGITEECITEGGITEECITEDDITEDNIIDQDIENNMVLNCTICYNNITKDNNSILNCQHNFCIDCIEKLLNNSKYTCPLCRVKIDSYINKDIINKVIYIRNNRNNRNNTENNEEYPCHIHKHIPIYIVSLILFFTNIGLSNNYNHLYNNCINSNYTYYT